MKLTLKAKEQTFKDFVLESASKQIELLKSDIDTFKKMYHSEMTPRETMYVDEAIAEKKKQLSNQQALLRKYQKIRSSATVEEIEKLTIYQLIEQLPNMYKEMITNIHEYDSNIKIIINPTMIKGIDDDFNRKSLMLTEALVYDLKDIQNVFFVPGYLSQPLFAGANKESTSGYPVSSDINNNKYHQFQYVLR